MKTQHSIYPVGIHAEWRLPADESLNSHLKSWLLDRQSLTKRLVAHSRSFRVQVLGQQVTQCPIHEANDDIHAGESVLAREVLLFCDEVPHVFARSLLPLRSLTGAQADLSQLGNESLGQVLFNHPDLTRKCIEVASFDAHRDFSSLFFKFHLCSDHLLWGRRSVFLIEDKPLMVAEVFLPNAAIYQKNKVC